MKSTNARPAKSGATIFQAIIVNGIGSLHPHDPPRGESVHLWRQSSQPGELQAMVDRYNAIERRNIENGKPTGGWAFLREVPIEEYVATCGLGSDPVIAELNGNISQTHDKAGVPAQSTRLVLEDVIEMDAVTPVASFLVDSPDDWHPQSVFDLPPNVERVEHGSEFTARSFVAHYNRLEMKEPTGHWAVCK